MKCGNCGQDILQTHPEMCPYCHSKNLISDETASQEAEQLAKAGQYEEAALAYERFDMWDEAKNCRLLARRKHAAPADFQVAAIEKITLKCPHCGFSQTLASRAPEETCDRCGTTYKIPEYIQKIPDFETSAKKR